MQRTYKLIPELRAKEGIKDFIADYEGNSYVSYYVADKSDDELLQLLHSFTASQEYKNFYTPQDKRHLIHGVSSVNAGDIWRIGQSESDDDGLFSVSVPQERLESTFYDALVLSGAIGWAADDSPEVVDHGLKHGLTPRSTYQLIGAIANSEVQSVLEGHYSTTHESVTTDQYVGADIHGDFRADRIKYANQNIIAPGGERVGFAPVISHEKAFGYHSTELDIVEAVILQLKYLLSASSYDEKAQDLLRRMPQDEGIGRILFADFGDDSSYRVYDTSSRELQDGEILARFIDSPMTDKGETTLIHTKDKLVFAHFSRKNQTVPTSEMTIPNEELVDFLLELSRAGQGRTSVYAIRELIERSRKV